MARVAGIAVLILFVLFSAQTQGISNSTNRSPGGLESSHDPQPHQSERYDPIRDRSRPGSPEPRPSAQLFDQVSQSAPERDYITPPSELPAIRVLASLSEFDIVSYTAFNGTNYSLYQFNGKYVAILIKPADIDLFTIARVRDLLDRVDILYAHFKEFLPLEPAGPGLDRIAFVQTCGGGCGFIGAKGIEIDPGLLNPNSWGPEGLYGGSGPYAYIVHEMTHNFDRYSPFIMFGPDAGHSWTDFMNFYVGVYDRFGTLRLTPEALLQSAIDTYFRPYLIFPGSTWETCIRDNLCDPAGGMQQHAQGGMMLRAAQLHGAQATRQAMAYLQNAITTRGLNPGLMTVLEKNDLLIESLSHGAAANLACYADAWHWPVSAALRAQLNAAFGVNSNCQDIDTDGYSPVRGDCSDANSAVNPGASEVINSVDDNCNGIVDDLLSTEAADFPNEWQSAVSIPVPARVEGAISSTSDSDNFRINLATSALITFRLRSLGTFKGWFFLLNQNSGDWRAFFYVGEGVTEFLNVSLGPGQWNFYVDYNAASSVGSYELITRFGDEWPLPFSVPRAAIDHFNNYVLVAPVIPSYLSGYTNVMVRFWVSGIGWVGTVPASPTMQTQFGWTVPAGTDVSRLRYRVQFLSGAVPVTDVSSAAGFAVSPPVGLSSETTDFDADGKTDIGFYRAGLWGFLKSAQSYSLGSAQFFSWGGSGTQPVCADFDGDDKADIAYLVPPSGGQSAAYAILQSTTGYSFMPGDVLFVPAGFPVLGDTPVVGDFDGDGKADPGIWRASEGVWIIPKSSTNYTSYIFSQWGQAGDTPVIADFDMDGKSDIGFYRDGLWGVLKSGQNFSLGSAQFFGWGGAGLQPIVGDFDGDNKADIGYIVPPAGGQSAVYGILQSSTGYSFLPGNVLFIPAGFPVLEDTPLVGDFDGDGKDDPGIWRESRTWIVPLSSSNYTTHIFSQWGQTGDIPFPNTTGKH